MQWSRAWKALAIVMAVALVFTYMPQAAAAKKLNCYKNVPRPWVCLTIDDGYKTASLKSMLKTLRKYKVKCTFFVIGTCLLKPDKQPLWRQAVRDGHEICYHTMRHQGVTKLSRKQIAADIAAWERAARKVLGATYRIPKFARLPGGSGSSDQRILKIFAARGYKVIRWNVDTLTGAVNRGIKIRTYIQRRTRPGCIILTHFNGYDSSALPGYIGWLKKKFKLGRLSDAFAPIRTPAPKPQKSPTPTPAATPLPTLTPEATPAATPTPTGA